MATYRWIAGDTEPITVFITDRGSPLPLVGVAVTLYSASALDGDVVSVSCTVIDPDGEIRFVAPAQWETPGIYRVQWRVVFSPGTPDESELTIPNGNDGDFWDTFEIGIRLAA